MKLVRPIFAVLIVYFFSLGLFALHGETTMVPAASP